MGRWVEGSLEVERLAKETEEGRIRAMAAPAARRVMAKEASRAAAK